MRVEHELHHRRLGRNLGLALVLLTFVGLVFGLTLVKTKRGDFAMKPAPGAAVEVAPKTQEGSGN